jgi:hypothetical protein
LSSKTSCGWSLTSEIKETSSHAKAEGESE